MIAHQHQVPLVLWNKRPLGLGMRAPKHEDGGAPLLRHMPNDGICQSFPAALGMAGGLALFHRQAGVEQQHAMLGPAHQTAAGLRRCGKWRAQIALHFLEDILQRWRQSHP